MKKPRATYKDFPGLSKKKAQKLAQAANKIVELLWELSPATRQKALNKAMKRPEVEGV